MPTFVVPDEGDYPGRLFYPPRERNGEITLITADKVTFIFNESTSYVPKIMPVKDKIMFRRENCQINLYYGQRSATSVCGTSIKGYCYLDSIQKHRLHGM